MEGWGKGCVAVLVPSHWGWGVPGLCFGQARLHVGWAEAEAGARTHKQHTARPPTGARTLLRMTRPMHCAACLSASKER
jgi:hypothetical protein